MRFALAFLVATLATAAPAQERTLPLSALRSGATFLSADPLQRRIRACLFGVRAQMPSPGAPELTDVELYLAWRAQGLPLESPGVRR
jgi:hypothetical protein